MFCLDRARRRSNCRPKEDGPGQAVLSSSSHSTAHTGTNAGSVVVNASIRPPPPTTGVSRAFVRMHRPLTSMFGWRFLCLWGQFVGTYSASAYAAYAERRACERPAHCGFAVEIGSGEALHRHVLCVPMHLPYSMAWPGTRGWWASSARSGAPVRTDFPSPEDTSARRSD